MPLDHHGPVQEVVRDQGHQGGPHSAVNEGLDPQCVLHPGEGISPVQEADYDGCLLPLVIPVETLQDPVPHLHQIMITT